MPSSELHAVSLPGDVAATKGRVQGLEQREGSPTPLKIVEINATMGLESSDGATLNSSVWTATHPVQFFEVILRVTPDDNETFEIRKNHSTVHSITPPWNGGAETVIRQPVGFKLERDDHVGVYVLLNSIIRKLQIQMRGTSAQDGSGTLTFSSTVECFVPSTPVLTPTGSVPIGSLTVGAEIVSAGGVVGSVAKIMWRNARTRIVWFGVEAIVTTDEHPFSVNGEWVKARSLEAGMLVDHHGGLAVEVTGNEQAHAAEVVNLTTTTGTFHVGSGLLVHNK